MFLLTFGLHSIVRPWSTVWLHYILYFIYYLPGLYRPPTACLMTWSCTQPSPAAYVYMYVHLNLTAGTMYTCTYYFVLVPRPTLFISSVEFKERQKQLQVSLTGK